MPEKTHWGFSLFFRRLDLQKYADTKYMQISEIFYSWIPYCAPLSVEKNSLLPLVS